MLFFHIQFIYLIALNYVSSHSFMDVAKTTVSNCLEIIFEVSK